MKASIQSAKRYEFTGELDNVPSEVLKAIGLPEDYAYTVKLEGHFRVYWDDNIPTPEVDGIVWAINPDDDNKFTDVTDLVDLDRLNDQLQTFETSSWYEDRHGALIDKAYDDYIDRMMDEAGD